MLSIENFLTLGMLVLLQAVLGFDNLLYISIESKRVEAGKQATVRRWGIGLAILLRIILLFVVIGAIERFKDPICSVHVGETFHCAFSVHSMIVLAGGIFIIYTAFKEIFHMLAADHVDDPDSHAPRSVAVAVAWIVVMNLVFSFDSILSALALTDVFWVMAVAIVISGALMVWLADHVAEFLDKNRMYEVLGLFILLIVGVMLVSEGGHLAHLSFFSYTIEPMAKSTFYFVIAILVVIDIVQGRYQKKLVAQRRRRAAPA
jgi:predicted tellurium resistance membrane protein TerC